MTPFTNILIDVDTAASEHPALDRAVRLAEGLSARLTLVDVMTVSPEARRDLPEAVVEVIASRRRERLEAIVREVTSVPATSKHLVGRPGTVLVQEVLREGYDLLMRSHARGPGDQVPRPFGAIDMELLRRCPCPVYLVRPAVPGRPSQVLGAVHASTDDEVEQALNVRIAELTSLVARLDAGTATLFQAWAPFAETMIRSYASEEAFSSYVEEVRARTAADLERLTRSLGASAAGLATTSRRGRPEDVIPAFVEEQGIDLVVMGTVARAGLSGWLIGNTAERVLRRLSCSVLAVKPVSFVSPVSLEEV